ncbi:MAG: hypothetical protein WC610_03965 [Patescibacteria group bacterium]
MKNLNLAFAFLLAAATGFAQDNQDNWANHRLPKLRHYLIQNQAPESSAPPDSGEADKNNLRNYFSDYLVSALKKPKVKLAGKYEMFVGGYWHKQRGKENSYGEIRFRPKATINFTDNLLLYLEGDFRQDSRGFAHGYINNKTESDYRWAVGIREGYLEYIRNRFRLRVGKQIFDWSVTDLVSPSDNLNPRDWTHLVEWEKIGVPAIDVRMGYDHFLEFVYVPYFTPSKLPQGRWEQLAMENYEVDGGGQYAIRAGTTFKGFDLTASFFDGFSYNPAVKTDAAKVGFDSAGMPIMPMPHFHPLYYRERVWAATLTKEIYQGYTMRTEVGYFDQEIGNNFFQYVVGVDREWNNVFRPTDNLYLLFQYAGDTSSKSERVGDIRRSLSNGVMLKAKYAFDDSERWALGLEAVYNLENSSSYVKPSVAYKKNNMTIEAGVAIMSGAKETFFGGYGRNDYGYLKVSWEF